MQDDDIFDFSGIENTHLRQFVSEETREMYRILTQSEDLIPVLLRVRSSRPRA